MKNYVILLLSLIPFLANSQARLVINNDAYLTMDGGIFIVLDNNNPNAITTTGSGGNIVSEDETNKVRWEIGIATGNYVVPFYTDYNAAGVKIPYTLNITGAGTGAGRVDFSTWETTTGDPDLNTPWPTTVTHMLDAATATVDNSYNVIDRFWFIDANGYTTRPAPTMTITYNDAVNEIGNSNTLTEANLVAQRFDDFNNAWAGSPSMSSLFYGTANTAANTVGPFAVTPAEFFAAWTLSDNTALLPIELVKFEANCQGQGTVNIQWVTASENNNDYFTLYKSQDGYNFVEMATITGAGNSSSPLNYSFLDEAPYPGITYYKLEQTDFDGTSKSFDVIALECGSNGNYIVTQFENQNEELEVVIKAANTENYRALLLDARGRIMGEQRVGVSEGQNVVRFNTTGLETGVYYVRFIGTNSMLSTKTFLK